MIRRHYQYRQTIATILSDEEDHISAAIDGMLGARREIEACIAADPFFGVTYFPYIPSCPGDAVRRMGDASKRAQVGPMAAVAGTIAWAGVEAMVREGAVFGVVDNGGDIAILADRTVRVGIHAGSAPSSNRMAFLVPPAEEILGICTSSATVGPSVSLGVADAVTVVGHDVAAMDAWATAICNRVTPDDDRALEEIADSGVQGVLVIIGDRVQKYGSLPPLVPARVETDLITRG